MYRDGCGCCTSIEMCRHFEGKVLSLCSARAAKEHHKPDCFRIHREQVYEFSVWISKESEVVACESCGVEKAFNKFDVNAGDRVLYIGDNYDNALSAFNKMENQWILEWEEVWNRAL